LRADAGSEAHFSLRTLSAWIATPLNGAATLSGSALVASGALGAYTWFVETDSQGLTTATASFGSNLSFDIDIPSTVFAALVGDAEVRAGSDVQGYCYAVPETGLPALGLAVLGLAGLAGQRRRNTRRGA
ncbi:MAG TPA: hypothetical protein VLH81_01255, partial [Desulfobacterales bacterium]|nr:hypothetical protein [Desulfobacterales bacterium]